MHYLSNTVDSMSSGASYYAHNCIYTVKNGIVSGHHALVSGCQAAADKTRNFVYKNYDTLLFTASTTATAYFAPHLFLPGAVAAIIVRLEVKNFVNEYIKDKHNPYIQNPKFGPAYISTSEFVLALAAAVDAVALGTVFYTQSWSISLLPVLGGIAAGSVGAKLGMDWFHKPPQPEPVQHIA